jgi:transcription antitermination factor NusA-like protein
MRVNSTGLGTTTMVANFEGFQTVVTEKLAGQYVGKDGKYIVIGVEAVKPIHWNIRITMDGQDLRKFIKNALKPKVIFRMLSIFIRGSSLD